MLTLSPSEGGSCPRGGGLRLFLSPFVDFLLADLAGTLQRHWFRGGWRSRLTARSQLIQCAPDLLPSDIINTALDLQPQSRAAVRVRACPIFANVLLVDENQPRFAAHPFQTCSKRLPNGRVTSAGVTRRRSRHFFPSGYAEPGRDGRDFSAAEPQLEIFFLIRAHPPSAIRPSRRIRILNARSITIRSIVESCRYRGAPTR